MKRICLSISHIILLLNLLMFLYYVDRKIRDKHNTEDNKLKMFHSNQADAFLLMTEKISRNHISVCFIIDCVL